MLGTGGPAGAAPSDPPGSWTFVSGPTSAGLLAVDMLSASEAWAAGANGTILHWDGATWHSVTSPVSDTLRGIAMLSPSDGWIVGGDAPYGSPPRSVILRWDGATWHSATNPVSDTLSGIAMLSSVDGWIVGGNSEYGASDRSVILHWDGSVWTPVANPVAGSNALMTVTALTATDAWAAGGSYVYPGNENGVILHWDGSAWTVATPYGLMSRIDDLQMVSATDGWALGGYCWYPGCDSYIYRWNGSVWTLFTGEYTCDLRSIGMVRAAEGWAGGCNGSRFELLFYDGSQWDWLAEPFNGGAVQDFDMLPSGDGWAVGWGGLTARYSSSPAGVQITRLGAAPATTGLALAGALVLAASLLWRAARLRRGSATTARQP